jgi:hypothetical protein
MGNKPGTSVSEDDLMGITAMAYITKCKFYSLFAREHTLTSHHLNSR